MNHEQERKRLNRRLLQGTFWDELKSLKRKPWVILRDVVTIFVACFAATWLAALLPATSWLTETVFFLLAMAVVTMVGKLTDKAFHNLFKK